MGKRTKKVFYGSTYALIPLCRYVLCIANGVANFALFAKWFLIEYISCVGSPDISFRCSYAVG